MCVKHNGAKTTTVALKISDA